MRIIIEAGDMAGSQGQASMSGSTDIADDSTPGQDGGAGPDNWGGNGQDIAGDDTGPPPQALLAAIAEAGGGISGGSDNAGQASNGQHTAKDEGEDAGAGPDDKN